MFENHQDEILWKVYIIIIHTSQKGVIISDDLIFPSFYSIMSNEDWDLLLESTY